MFDADVLVCGLGPSGATVSALLAKRGMRVIAVEKRDDTFPLPRAIGWDHEAMRILQEIGVAEAVLPYTAPYRPSEYRGMAGQTIRRIEPAPPPHRFGWLSNYVFDQPGVERVLRGKLEATENIDVRHATTLDSFTQHGSSVSVSISTADGRSERLTVKLLLACDGGASAIRKALQVALEDLGFDEHWLVVDADVLPSKLAQLPQTQVQYCEPARPCSYVIGPGNHRRWEIMLLPGDSLSPEFPDNELWPLLSRWISPGEATIRRAAAYRFHGLVSADWRRGRVVLLGDAAHMTPPFMSQGMVQGMRDAQNLAWKIERVLKSSSPLELLDTYGEERRPHVITVTQAAMSLGREICERDPERARLRDARLGALAVNGVLPPTIRQNLIPPLMAGALVGRTPGAGQLCPQPSVSVAGSRGTQLLDEVTGARTRLICSAELDGDAVQALLDRLKPLDGCLVQLAEALPRDGLSYLVVVESESIVRDWLKGLEQSFVLVRPDHYVFATAPNLVGALQVINEFQGRLHAPTGISKHISLSNA